MKMNSHKSSDPRIAYCLQSNRKSIHSHVVQNVPITKESSIGDFTMTSEIVNTIKKNKSIIESSLNLTGIK